MRALAFLAPGRVGPVDVAEPTIVDPRDAIVRVRLSSVCGEDLPAIAGTAGLAPGDILGHELVGDVVATGDEVERLRVGDRVVVSAVVACGRCWHCTRGDVSLCDLAHPRPAGQERIAGHAGAAKLGLGARAGGLPGSHAEFVRVPFADVGCVPVPDAIPDAAALFVSEAAPAGWTAADRAGIQPGDVVAVWGLGAVGQLAARAAQLLGADRVIGIERAQDRLAVAERRLGIETVDLDEADVVEALVELTAGRGPDRCIDAAGAAGGARHRFPLPVAGVQWGAARFPGARRAVPHAAQQAFHQAVLACRKGGTVSVAGSFTSPLDGFRLGAVVDKGLTVRGAPAEGGRAVPLLLDHVAAGDLDPTYLLTHPLPLEDGARGYQLFERRWGGCLRAAFAPNGFAGLTGLRTFAAWSRPSGVVG